MDFVVNVQYAVNKLLLREVYTQRLLVFYYVQGRGLQKFTCMWTYCDVFALSMHVFLLTLTTKLVFVTVVRSLNLFTGLFILFYMVNVCCRPAVFMH